jgi:hypothetical protein
MSPSQINAIIELISMLYQVQDSFEPGSDEWLQLDDCGAGLEDLLIDDTEEASAL